MPDILTLHLPASLTTKTRKDLRICDCAWSICDGIVAGDSIVVVLAYVFHGKTGNFSFPRPRSYCSSPLLMEVKNYLRVCNRTWDYTRDCVVASDSEVALLAYVFEIRAQSHSSTMPRASFQNPRPQKYPELPTPHRKQCLRSC